jgi:hypothetical protein
MLADIVRSSNPLNCTTVATGPNYRRNVCEATVIGSHRTEIRATPYLETEYELPPWTSREVDPRVAIVRTVETHVVVEADVRWSSVTQVDGAAVLAEHEERTAEEV